MNAQAHSHHTACASLEFQIFNDDIDRLYLPLVTRASSDTTAIRQIFDQLVYDRSCLLYGLYVQKAKDYIHRHLNEPITQRQVDRHLDISPGYLCEIFRRTQQTTLMQYVNKRKLCGIQTLLEQKHLKLNEASALYGYADPNYVSRLYKKLFQRNITDKAVKY